MVWNFNYKIVVLPCLNVLAFTGTHENSSCEIPDLVISAAIACGIGTTHLYAVAPPGKALIHYPEAMNWIIADVVLSVLYVSKSSFVTIVGAVLIVLFHRTNTYSTSLCHLSWF